jgi:hypothetical protein
VVIQLVQKDRLDFQHPESRITTRFMHMTTWKTGLEVKARADSQEVVSGYVYQIQVMSFD